MKEVLLPTTANNSLPQLMPFRNKLADQEKSFLNMTYTVDTNKRERQREFQKEFGVDDAIRGFLPRARSSGPRRSCKEERTSNVNVRNFSDSTIYSQSCALPSLDSNQGANKACATRPWSRTHEELRKFKQTLQQQMQKK